MFGKIRPYLGAVAIWVTTFCLLLFGGFTFNEWAAGSWDLLGIILIAIASFTTAVIFHWSRSRPTGE